MGFMDDAPKIVRVPGDPEAFVMKFRVEEVAPHVVVEAHVEGLLRWRVALFVLKLACAACMALGMEIGVVLHRKGGEG
jgi:hypothetical protein